MSGHGAGRDQRFIAASPVHKAFYGADPRTEAKLKERERLRFAPRFDALIYGKRYIVPNYRQDHYYPQNVANKMAASSLLVPMQAPYSAYDDVANAALCNILQAARHGRPQLWLERELAEPLMRTELPEDMSAEDVRWRWQGFRVHLPKGLLRLAGDPDHDLMFMDICTVPARTRLRVPEPYASEICALGKEYGWAEPGMAREFQTTPYDQTALMISGNLNGKDNQQIDIEDLKRGDLMCYAVVKPFDEAIKFGQIRRITKADGDLSSPYEVTETDHAFCEKMLHIALQILIYLGSTPMEYQPEQVLRKPRLEGKHSLPGLYAARFVGSSQLRAVHNTHSAQPVNPSGRHYPGQWRAGHWKRQVHGAGRQQRKLIWILPYQTYESEDPKKAEK